MGVIGPHRLNLAKIFKEVKNVQEFVFKSVDGEEKALLSIAQGKRRPLLVGLHTWSADLDNQVNSYGPPAKDRDWSLILPSFRGPNLVTNPRRQQACASPLAIADILHSVDAFCERYPEKIDKDKIYLLGGSGGGHMALCALASDPKRWRMVSSWCPITDLEAWHSENPNYAPHIAACCGGEPGESPQVDWEYFRRSPINMVKKLAQGRVFINHGKYDPSVPYTHSLRLYNALCEAGGHSQYLNIFPGGHDLYVQEAFAQLEYEKESSELSG